jgi:hypothetical protein
MVKMMMTEFNRFASAVGKRATYNIWSNGAMLGKQLMLRPRRPKRTTQMLPAYVHCSVRWSRNSPAPESIEGTGPARANRAE